MPNQATRGRRKAAGLPTNVQKLICDNDNELFVSRLGSKICTTRFVVVGNSPLVLMSWIGALLDCGTGFRLYPHQTYTVWVFSSTNDAACAIKRFNERKVIELPCYVPQSMRTHPMYLMNLVNVSKEMERLCSTL